MPIMNAFFRKGPSVFAVTVMLLLFLGACSRPIVRPPSLRPNRRTCCRSGKGGKGRAGCKGAGSRSADPRADGGACQRAEEDEVKKTGLLGFTIQAGAFANAENAAA